MDDFTVEEQLIERLSDGERRKLAQAAGLSQFQRDKLEKEAKKNWDMFYKRNGDRFFKNRYWTRKEFHELFTTESDVESSSPSRTRYLLEIGCGCGDFVLPLLDNAIVENDAAASKRQQSLPNDLFIYCCDISDKAIEILKSNSVYKSLHPIRVKAFTANVITDYELIRGEMEGRQMDYVSLVFVLSTLEPHKMRLAIENIHKLMKTGGLVLFRDYAIYDKAMLRFDEKSKICDQFYVRQDGTRAYFFTKSRLLNLFTEEDLFDCQSIDYIERETLNNATKDQHSRIFLQGKFTCKSKTNKSNT